MPSAAFLTLGCKVNQYETQRILEDFERGGFAITEFNEPADIYFINSCSVTMAAERKSRYVIRRAVRENPGAVVVVTGCYGEMALRSGGSLEGAHLRIPNSMKMESFREVANHFPALALSASSSSGPRSARPTHRTRATLKVQDGCDVFCAFCSIPYTRNRMVSRPPEEILAEASELVESGVREIVVTGVLVGAYRGPNNGWDLAALLSAIADTPGLTRVRLSSIEPTQVTDRLIDTLARHPGICPHLHIPLQSGDTNVLARMNRPYDREFYVDRVARAKAAIPDLAVTADIMVGFPGETDEAFKNTLAVVSECEFARAHLFRYSPRPGTPAAAMNGHLPDDVKEERAAELAAHCVAAQQRFIARHIGTRAEVLVEGKRAAPLLPVTDTELSGNAAHPRIDTEAPPGVLLSGYTRNYIHVQFTGGSGVVGKVIPVQLLEPAPGGALGQTGNWFGADEPPPDADFLSLCSLPAIA